MAAASRDVSSLEQKLMCQVCHEVFQSKPFSLKCLHNYCESCLRKLPRETKDGNEGISCPVCRQFSKKDDVQHNFILDDIVQGFKHLYVDRILNKIPDNKCGHCGRNDPITALCLVCEKQLCMICKERHVEIAVGHEVVSTDNKQGSITVSLAKSCSVHLGQPIRAHCKLCQKAICSECKLGTHDTHPTESVDQALKILTPMIKTNLDAIQIKANNIKEMCDLVEKNTNNIAENHRNILQNAEREMNRRIQRIKDEYKALQDQIYTQPILKEGMMVKQDLEASASSLESLISWGYTLLDMTQGPGTLYEIQNNFMLRINSLTNEDTDLRDSREFMRKVDKYTFDFVTAEGENLLGKLFTVQTEKIEKRGLVTGNVLENNNSRAIVLDEQMLHPKHLSIAGELPNPEGILEDCKLFIKIKWQYQDKDKYVDYPPNINFIIENAYNAKQTNIQWDEVDNTGTPMSTPSTQCHIIEFNKMVEHIVGNTECAVAVRRYAPASIELPTRWERMSPSENFKVVDVPKDDPDYEEVSIKFKDGITEGTGVLSSTFSAVNAVEIKSIKRVQNPRIYRNCLTRKNQMQMTLKPGHPCEHELWHGTSADTIEEINVNGFNRSYCGKIAMVYGDGVYFAVNANYSHRYAQPDPQGNRIMYLCRVLTGEFTKGNNGIKVPPPKDATVASIKYDSVVDNVNQPAMYVVFYDDQAYPQYEITYTAT